MRRGEKQTGWMLVAMVIVAVMSIGMSSAHQGRNETRTVGIMLGCLEVPSATRVVLTENLIDAWLGYVELPGKARVWWAAGMWANWLEPTPERKVLWVKPGHGPEVRSGMVRQGEVEILVLDTGLVHFLLPGGTENDLGLLEAVAGTRRHLKQDECVRPEIKLADRPF